MTKIFICGDSFAADWTVKYKGQGWPNMLTKDYAVTNVAQAGVSEYKIYKQLIAANLDQYDAVVIAHTSPYRIYVKEHPVHSKDSLHAHCDLIYSDLKESEATHPEVKPIITYFENYFDTEHAEFVHSLICEKIVSLCEKYSHKVINLINFKDQYNFPNSINFEQVFKDHRGTMNHFNDTGNKIVYNEISKKIREIIK